MTTRANSPLDEYLLSIKTKICSKCSEIKPLIEFHSSSHSKDGKISVCKKCSNERNKKRLQKRIQFLNSRKGFCIVCGEKNKKVLVYHHMNPKNKLFNISDIPHHSLETIALEHAKCVVVCDNCHKEYHYYDRNPTEVPKELLEKYKSLNMWWKEGVIEETTEAKIREKFAKQYNKNMPREEFKKLHNNMKRALYLYKYKKQRRKTTKKLIYRFKTPCVVCGEKRKPMLEFHHKDPKTKTCTINIARTTLPREKLIAEIKKCAVLCGNCHRLLHCFKRNPEETPTELFERYKELDLQFSCH